MLTLIKTNTHFIPLQDSISSLEHCKKPVIAAVHSACIGAGINLITAADIRYCSDDAFFQVAEVNIGMAADVGALQHLPKIVGNQSWVREICLTGRRVDSKEALLYGLVNRVIHYFYLLLLQSKNRKTKGNLFILEYLLRLLLTGMT